MDYKDYYWGFYKDYKRDLFPHSLPSTRASLVYLHKVRGLGFRV